MTGVARSEIADPTRLHDHWESVRPDIVKCLSQDRDDVWVEDVYTAIRIGSAFLLLGYRDDDTYAGMAVLVEHTDQYQPRNKILHIWLCSTESEIITREGLKLIESFAAQRGCKAVTLRSSRAAFERWGMARGFQIGDFELRKEL